MKSKAEELADSWVTKLEKENSPIELANMPCTIAFDGFLAGYAARDSEVKELQARLDEAVKILNYFTNGIDFRALTACYPMQTAEKARQFLKELKGVK